MMINVTVIFVYPLNEKERARDGSHCWSFFFLFVENCHVRCHVISSVFFINDMNQVSHSTLWTWALCDSLFLLFFLSSIAVSLSYCNIIPIHCRSIKIEKYFSFEKNSQNKRRKICLLKQNWLQFIHIWIIDWVWMTFCYSFVKLSLERIQTTYCTRSTPSFDVDY